jgi:hypothetical protein
LRCQRREYPRRYVNNRETGHHVTRTDEFSTQNTPDKIKQWARDNCEVNREHTKERWFPHVRNPADGAEKKKKKKGKKKYFDGVIPVANYVDTISTPDIKRRIDLLPNEKKETEFTFTPVEGKRTCPQVIDELYKMAAGNHLKPLNEDVLSELLDKVKTREEFLQAAYDHVCYKNTNEVMDDDVASGSGSRKRKYSRRTKPRLNYREDTEEDDANTSPDASGLNALAHAASLKVAETESNSTPDTQQERQAAPPFKLFSNNEFKLKQHATKSVTLDEMLSMVDTLASSRQEGDIKNALACVSPQDLVSYDTQKVFSGYVSLDRMANALYEYNRLPGMSQSIREKQGKMEVMQQGIREKERQMEVIQQEIREKKRQMENIQQELLKQQEEKKKICDKDY